jgi:tetratricopeptide (TPR) repeat protein
MASNMPNTMANEMLSVLMENMQFEDVDELNAFMQENVVGKRIDDVISEFKGDGDPQIKSMQLLEQAQQTMLPHKAKKLTQEALKLDPSNGDAYVLLASMERSPQRALAVLKKGVVEAKKGIHDFEEIKGHFWGLHHTRPYMRVRQELADLFYELEDINEAIRHYQEMIILNPNDNQGLRYKLGVMLVDNGNEKAYLNLRDTYPEDFSACWSFTYAFYLFKKEGNSVAAKMALRQAHNQNKFVIPFLAQMKPFPAQLPGYYGIGDENEAAYAVLDLIELIDNTEGLLDWVSDFAVGK